MFGPCQRVLFLRLVYERARATYPKVGNVGRRIRQHRPLVRDDVDRSHLMHPAFVFPYECDPLIVDPRGEIGAVEGKLGRSEERRVGKEWFSTCRSGWSPDHENKKQK